MSTRTRIAPNQLDDIDMSAASTASEPTLLASNSTVVYSGSWTGSTPVGTLALQMSEDFSLSPTGAAANAGTWVTVPISIGGVYVTSGTVSGNTGTFLFDVVTGVNATRLLYTKGSGTGTLSIYVSARVQ